MNKKINLQNGITLIALVITIVITVILAGVAINATIGENRDNKKGTKCKNRATNERGKRKIRDRNK